jgi:hypothetical protein
MGVKVKSIWRKFVGKLELAALLPDRNHKQWKIL